MGYNLTIGQRKEEVQEDGYIYTFVDCVHLNEAPAFDESSDYTNERNPSYTAWSLAMEALATEDLFYSSETHSPMGGNPGYFVITQSYLNLLETHKKRLEILYPDAEATYDENHPTHSKYVYTRRIFNTNEEIPINFALCRFEWMYFWANWAFKNCEMPIFHNS